MSLISTIEFIVNLFKVSPISGAILTFPLLLIFISFIMYLKKEPSLEKRFKKIGLGILFLLICPPICFFMVSMLYPIFF